MTLGDYSELLELGRCCNNLWWLFPSAGRGGHLFVLGTLEEGGVVGGVHLERSLGGDGRRAAAAASPSIRMEELARVVGTIAEARPVEALVGPVHLLRCVALHKQVHGHHASRLQWQIAC